MSALDDKAIFARFVNEVWNEGKLDVVAEIMSKDYVVNGHPARPENAKKFVAMYRAAFPDIKVVIDQQISEGDWVATRWTLQGTDKGGFDGRPPTGKRAKVTGITINRIGDGKMAEEWETFEPSTLLRQLR